MKNYKFVVALVVMGTIIASGAFAEGYFDLKSGPTQQKNTIFVDVGTMVTYLIWGGFGAGVGYERAFNDSWTGLIHVAAGGFSYDLGPYFGKSGAFALQVDVHGRWYFFKTALDKLFVDLGLGYEYYGYSYESDSDNNWNQSSFTISPKVGWKFIFGKWFVLEPAVGYTFGIPLGKPDNLYGATARSASGFNLGIALGGAF